MIEKTLTVTKILIIETEKSANFEIKVVLKLQKVPLVVNMWRQQYLLEKKTTTKKSLTAFVPTFKGSLTEINLKKIVWWFASNHESNL